MLRIRLAIFTLLALCLSPTLRSQTLPDTCWVEGYLFGNDMQIARSGTVVIKRIEKSGYLFTWRPSAEAKADSTGFVRIPLPRGSTAYLYSQHLYSISRDQTNGTPIPIPNAPTARLENLPPATSVPSTYMVAVPLLTVTHGETSGTVSTLELRGSAVTASEISGNQMVVTLTGGFGSSGDEQDPTATAQAATVLDSAFTQLSRSITMSGRIAISPDSMVMTVLSDTLDARRGNVFRTTVTRADTIHVANLADGQPLQILVTAGNSSAALIFTGGVSWPSGIPPVLTPAQNRRDLFSFVRIGSVIVGTQLPDVK